MRRLEIGQPGIDSEFNQPQEPILPVLNGNGFSELPDNSIGEVYIAPDSNVISTLSNNSQPSSRETRIEYGNRLLREVQERLIAQKRIFGETEEEQRANFERQYHEAGSLKRLSGSLARNGINLNYYSLRRVAKSLEIPWIRLKIPVNKPRVRRQLSDIVRKARERGAFDQLPPDLQQVLDERCPQDGRPKSLDEIGRGVGLTRERIRQKEDKALGIIRRMLAHKRVIDHGVQ